GAPSGAARGHRQGVAVGARAAAVGRRRRERSPRAVGVGRSAVRAIGGVGSTGRELMTIAARRAMERLVDAAAGAQFSFGDRDVPLEASMQSLLEALARTIPEDNVVHAVVRDAYRGWKARRLEDLL